MRQLLTAFSVTLLLAACAPQPFDATSPWKPLMQGGGEGRSFRGGMMAAAPATTFDEFESGERESGAAPSGPQSVIPSGRGGENPWATIPKNPVVTVCYGVLNGREQVEAAAQRLCPDGARLELIQTSTFQSECPLVQPSRAAFRCWTQDPEQAAERSGAQ